MKPTMTKILQNLGFKGINDFETIVPPNIFEKLDMNLVVQALKEHNLHFITSNEVNTNEELIFENVNRILELRYGRIIDSLKEIDELGDGYKIEVMPDGGV